MNNYNFTIEYYNDLQTIYDPTILNIFINGKKKIRCHFLLQKNILLPHYKKYYLEPVNEEILDNEEELRAFIEFVSKDEEINKISNRLLKAHYKLQDYLKMYYKIHSDYDCRANIEHFYEE